MTAKQRENFENYVVYTVEIPAKDQNTPEINEAKHKEIENLIKFDVFEEVDDCSQERISTRWVVTQKKKSEGHKSQIGQKLEISKLEDNEFRFTGMDAKKDSDVIVVSMEDYAKSLER